VVTSCALSRRILLLIPIVTRARVSVPTHSAFRWLSSLAASATSTKAPKSSRPSALSTCGGQRGFVKPSFRASLTTSRLKETCQLFASPLAPVVNAAAGTTPPDAFWRSRLMTRDS